MVSIKSANEKDEILLTTLAGNIIRIPVSEIPIRGRRTHGVTLVNIKHAKEEIGDRVVAVARIDQSLISG